MIVISLGPDELRSNLADDTRARLRWKLNESINIEVYRNCKKTNCCVKTNSWLSVKSEEPKIFSIGLKPNNEMNGKESERLFDIFDVLKYFVGFLIPSLASFVRSRTTKVETRDVQVQTDLEVSNWLETSNGIESRSSSANPISSRRLPSKREKSISDEALEYKILEWNFLDDIRHRIDLDIDNSIIIDSDEEFGTDIDLTYHDEYSSANFRRYCDETEASKFNGIESTDSGVLTDENPSPPAMLDFYDYDTDSSVCSGNSLDRRVDRVVERLTGDLVLCEKRFKARMRNCFGTRKLARPKFAPQLFSGNTFVIDTSTPKPNLPRRY